MLLRAIAIVCLTACLTMGVAPRPIRLSAAAGRRAGAATLATTRPGGDAGGYATGFDKAGDLVSFAVPAAAAGMYDVRLRFCSPTGHKGATVACNGVAADVMFPRTADGWETFDAGRLELTSGENRLSVGGGWGHYDVAAVNLVPAEPTSPAKPTGRLSDVDATPATRDLMRRLLAGYARTTLAGGYGDREAAYVAAHAGGRRPAVFGADLMDFSPSRVAHGASPAGIVDGVLRHAAAGQAITLSWHWNAPAGLIDGVVTGHDGKPEDGRWYKGFNAAASTFDVSTAVADERSPAYGLLLRDIDAIAVPLRRLADAGVPVLWRPLHEAEGEWFWWGAHGPAASVKLWRLMYDRLTNHHGLHNLIWVYSCTILGDRHWYPGADVVDVVGVDAYPSDNRDALSAMWSHWSRLTPDKPLAVTEFGGVPDVGRMHRLGCPWLYFVSWNEPNGPATTGGAEVGRRYADGHVGDLAAWRMRAGRPDR